MPKKIADVGITRMLCGRKSSNKANGRLFQKTDLMQEVNFFVVLKFLVIITIELMFAGINMFEAINTAKTYL